MENTETILAGNTDQEKTAYLTAVASIATADKQASEEELATLTTLCEAAQLSPAQTEKVMNAARDPNGDDLVPSLDVLKTSELRYSLVADLIAFAKSDSNYSEAEQQSVTKISNYLGLNQEQFSALNQVAEKTASPDVAAVASSPNFLSSSGLDDKLRSVGINGGSLLKGLLAAAAPILISKIAGRRSGGGGMFGGENRGGGMFGGSGGLLGGLTSGGGLGSLIGMFNGGGGFGSAGNMLGKIFGGR